MSPQLHFVEAVDNEFADNTVRLSDVRRVSLSLAYSPARQRRRRQMQAAGNWLQSRLGIHKRRTR